jgi:Transposase IS200 like
MGGWHGQPGSIWKEAGTTYLIAVLNGALSSKARNVTAISLSCSELPKRFGARIHGYVLMANHYHLQVETPEANLSRAIQRVNMSYSIWFNRKYQRVGPLFQGRFKAALQ